MLHTNLFDWRILKTRFSRSCIPAVACSDPGGLLVLLQTEVKKDKINKCKKFVRKDVCAVKFKVINGECGSRQQLLSVSAPLKTSCLHQYQVHSSLAFNLRPGPEFRGQLGLLNETWSQKINNKNNFLHQVGTIERVS